MVGLQTLDLAIGVRVPASQPNRFKQLRAARISSRPFCVPIVCQLKNFGALASVSTGVVHRFRGRRRTGLRACTNSGCLDLIRCASL